MLLEQIWFLLSLGMVAFSCQRRRTEKAFAVITQQQPTYIQKIVGQKRNSGLCMVLGSGCEGAHRPQPQTSSRYFALQHPPRFYSRTSRAHTRFLFFSIQHDVRLPRAPRRRLDRRLPSAHHKGIDLSGNLQISIWDQNPPKLHMKAPHRVRLNSGFPGFEGGSLCCRTGL